MDVRALLVSVAAVCFAGAVGVTLGSGPLRGSTDRDLQDQVDALEQRADQRGDEVARLRNAADYEQKFAAAALPNLLGDKLKGHHVAVVQLPGADTSTVDGVTKMVEAGGGSVTGTVKVTEKWVRPGQRQFLDDLSTQLVTADLTVPESGGVYARAGTVLARALVTKDTKAVGKPDSEITGILTGYNEGGLVGNGEPKGLADLAVVVAPEPPTDISATDRDAAAKAWAAMAKAIDTGGNGAVLAGPVDAAKRDGALRAARADKEIAGAVSTVDVADTPSGQAAVARSLVEQLDGKAGQYGATGKDGAAPK